MNGIMSGTIWWKYYITDDTMSLKIFSGKNNNSFAMLELPFYFIFIISFILSFILPLFFCIKDKIKDKIKYKIKDKIKQTTKKTN